MILEGNVRYSREEQYSNALLDIEVRIWQTERSTELSEIQFANE
jgi:hypothetical protein